MSKLKQCVELLIVLHPAHAGTEMQLGSAQELLRDAGINFAVCRKAQVCCLATTCMYEWFSCLYLCDSKKRYETIVEKMMASWDNNKLGWPGRLIILCSLQSVEALRLF